MSQPLNTPFSFRHFLEGRNPALKFDDDTRPQNARHAAQTVPPQARGAPFVSPPPARESWTVNHRATYIAARRICAVGSFLGDGDVAVSLKTT